VSFQPREGLKPYTCESRTRDKSNHSLTTAYLYHLLEQSSTTALEKDRYIPDTRFRRYISYVLQEHRQGKEVVWLEPYMLKATDEFGFLADFKFIKSDSFRFDREVQRLSLSLDRNDRSNLDFYGNRFEKLQAFIRTFAPQLFPLKLHNALTLNVRTTLRSIRASRLAMKRYVFKGNRTAASQFKGVQEYGPLKEVGKDVLLHFLHRQQDIGFSRDLYRALRGDTFLTFSGMRKMFGYNLGQEHVSGITLGGFRSDDLDRAIDEIQSVAGEKLVVPVIIVPWSRHDESPETRDCYFTIKHRFLRHDLPTQLVSLPTLKSQSTFKWSISNMVVA
jgi:hypothetical protein